MAAVIGRIRLRDGREAALTDDAVWESEDAALAAVLNGGFKPGTGGRPLEAVLPLGALTVPRAARELGAEVVLSPGVPPVADGEVS